MSPHPRIPLWATLPTKKQFTDPDDPSVRPVGIGGVFEVTNGPSYRLAIDMRALDRATIVITTGSGGNPFDRHYGDMIVDWLHGESVPLPFTPAAVERSAAATLTLVP